MCFKKFEVAKCKFSLVLALCCLLASRSIAANPIIESVSPPVGQRGSEIAIRIEGEGFSDTAKLVFYSDDIECTEVKVLSEYELEAKVRISETCSLQNQPFRVLAEHGFSDMRAIRVTPFPVLKEGVDAKSSSQNESIDLQNGVTVAGVLESGDIDRYQIDLKKGQVLSAEVEAVRLGYELLDTVLAITGPDGTQLVRCDDDALFQQDPVASIVAPESGRYVVSLHESNYGGGQTSHYALHLGSFARPGVAFPAGGAYGQTIQIELLAPDGTASQHVVRLPSEGKADGFEMILEGESGQSLPTPLPFRLSSLRSALEQEPNQRPDEVTQAIRFPGAIDGIISSPGDVDLYRLQIADTDELVCIEAFADRVGSPIDTMLRVFNAQGQLIASNDDRGSHDSRIEFNSRGETEFLVEVSDKLKAGQANGVYRLECTPVEPQLTTFLPRPDRVSQESQSIAIPVGNRVMKRVAIRRDYVEGEVSLQFTSLPVGVRTSLLSVPDDQFWVPAVLEADPDAPVGGGLAELVGTNDSDEGRVVGNFEQTVDLVHSTADQLFNSVTVNRLPVAVTAAIPFRVVLETPQSSLPAGGRLKVSVKIERDAGFDEPIRVRLPFLPPWVVSEPHVVVASGESTASFNLEAYPNVQPRNWQLVAVAEIDALSSEGEIGTVVGREVCSRLVELKTSVSPVTGAFQKLAVEQGQTLKAECKLNHPKLEGRFEAILEGLPNWLSAEPVTLEAGQTQFAFDIPVPADSPTGKFSRLQCRLTSLESNSQVSFVVAAGTDLTIFEPNKLKRDSEGRLLSPLEALRIK